VIAVDQRGHGASIAGDSGHGVEHIGDDLALVLRELDLRDAILIGHSMGGIAVQSFAIRHPDVARERVRGLILLSTLCRTPVGSRSTQLRDAIEHVTRRAPDSTRLWKTKNLGFLLARIGFGREPYASEVELVRQMLRDCPHDTRVAATRSLIGIDLTDALAAISHPTLVVCGTADAITPPFHARQIHEAIAGSRLELVEGAGHMIMLERAELLHGLIHDFAREVAG
jgi:pimeloyl-ACP methyl ester carboxylesterase